jgi:hypothetical protein
MFDYLKRNLEFLTELKSAIHQIDKNAPIIGESTHTKFIHLKTFESKVADEQVYVGLKLSNREFEYGFYTALTNIAFLCEKNPEIVDKLPLFYGLLVNQNNKPEATITQDFSMNNKVKVEEYVFSKYKPEYIPYLLGSFFRDCEEDLERTIFLVGGKTKIGDLDHIYPKEEYSKEWFNLRNKIKYEKHTISLE